MHPTLQPTIPSLFRRLDSAIRRGQLQKRQRLMRERLTQTQRELDTATADLITLARLHRQDPALRAHSRALRLERDSLELQLRAIGLELDHPTPPRSPFAALLLGLFAVPAHACGGGTAQEPNQPKPEACK